MYTHRHRGGESSVQFVLDSDVSENVDEDVVSAAFRMVITKYTKELRALLREVKIRARVLLGIRKKPHADDTTTIEAIAKANALSNAKIESLVTKCKQACKEESEHIARTVARASPTHAELAESAAKILETARQLSEIAVDKEVHELEEEIARSTAQIIRDESSASASTAKRTRRARVARKTRRLCATGAASTDTPETTEILSEIILESDRKIRQLRSIQKNIEERGLIGLDNIRGSFSSTKRTTKGGAAIPYQNTRRTWLDPISPKKKVTSTSYDALKYVAWISGVVVLMWIVSEVGGELATFFGDDGDGGGGDGGGGGGGGGGGDDGSGDYTYRYFPPPNIGNIEDYINEPQSGSDGDFGGPGQELLTANNQLRDAYHSYDEALRKDNYDISHGRNFTDVKHAADDSLGQLDHLTETLTGIDDHLISVKNDAEALAHQADAALAETKEGDPSFDDLKRTADLANHNADVAKNNLHTFLQSVSGLEMKLEYS